LFRGAVDLLGLLDGYADQAAATPGWSGDGTLDVFRAARVAARSLSLHESRLVPCHNDPTPANMRGRDRTVLVDWEYAAPNDPCWDVAYFELAADLDNASRLAWRRSYLGRPPTVAESRRLGAYMVALGVLTGLWFVCQSATTSEPDSDPTVLNETATRCFARAQQAAVHQGLVSVRR
jgi:thiamine kinase-like enzyme